MYSISNNLAVKYRPGSLRDFVGNLATKRALANALSKKEDKPHLILFSGPSGCGKTTLARIVANHLGAKGNSLVNVNASQKRGIDDVKNLMRSVVSPPISSENRVIILDEAHGLTKDAQNCLLTFLEELPSFNFVVLCSTEPKKLLPTIINRCVTFSVEALSKKEILSFLASVCKKEGFKSNVEVLSIVADSCNGSSRLALNLLEACSSMEDLEEIKKVVHHVKSLYSDGVELTGLSAAIYSVMQKNSGSDVKKFFTLVRKDLLSLVFDRSSQIDDFISGVCYKVTLEAFKGEQIDFKKLSFIRVLNEAKGKGRLALIPIFYEACKHYFVGDVHFQEDEFFSDYRQGKTYSAEDNAEVKYAPIDGLDEEAEFE